MKELRKLFALIISISTLSLWIACNSDNSNTTDSKKEADKHNDAKFDSKAERDAKFVSDAADISLFEMQLGQLAATNAASIDVKNLGAMMSKDHKKAYDDLASLASKKTITIPSALTESEQKDYNALAAKTGTDFDKDYCDKMVNGHKDAIEEFEKESKNAGDADIQAWATNTLPILRSHLDYAMTCQEKYRNTKNNSASQ